MPTVTHFTENKHVGLFLAFPFGWQREVMFEFNIGTKTSIGRGCQVSNKKRYGQTEMNHIWLCVNVLRLYTDSHTFDARITAGLKSSRSCKEHAQTDGE